MMRKITQRKKNNNSWSEALNRWNSNKNRLLSFFSVFFFPPLLPQFSRFLREQPEFNEVLFFSGLSPRILSTQTREKKDEEKKREEIVSLRTTNELYLFSCCFGLYIFIHIGTAIKIYIEILICAESTTASTVIEQQWQWRGEKKRRERSRRKKVVLRGGVATQTMRKEASLPPLQMDIKQKKKKEERRDTGVVRPALSSSFLYFLRVTFFF